MFRLTSNDVAQLCTGSPKVMARDQSTERVARILLWTLQRTNDTFAMCKGRGDQYERRKVEVLQGTLDLMILKTLHALGPQHGFGIARRIEQVSEEVLRLNEGIVYTSLLRLQQQGWIVAKWGVSENNRRARFYSITRAVFGKLGVEAENWERISGVIARILQLKSEG